MNLLAKNELVDNKKNLSYLLRKSAIWLFILGIFIFLINTFLVIDFPVTFQNISIYPIEDFSVGLFIVSIPLFLISIIITPAEAIENKKFWAKQTNLDLIIVIILSTIFLLIFSPETFNLLKNTDYLSNPYISSLENVLLNSKILAIMATMLQLSMGVIVLIKIWAKALPANLIQFKWKLSIKDFILIMCSLAFVYIFSYGFDKLLTLLGFQVPPQFLMSETWREGFLLFLLSAAIGAPLAEELFFRGYLQTVLTGKNVIWGIVLTSSIFAAFHLSVYYFVPIFVTGFILGYSYLHSKNLLVPIIIHSLNNLVAVIMMYFAK